MFHRQKSSRYHYDLPPVLAVSGELALMHPLKLSFSFSEFCIIMIILSSKFNSDVLIIWILSVEPWMCQNVTQLTGVKLNNWGILMWQTCLLPHWRERICHSWFACRALYNKLKLCSARIVCYQTELATHYIESVSSVERTDLKVLIRATVRALSYTAEYFSIKMTHHKETCKRQSASGLCWASDEAFSRYLQSLVQLWGIIFDGRCH